MDEQRTILDVVFLKVEKEKLEVVERMRMGLREMVRVVNTNRPIWLVPVGHMCRK